MASMNYCFTVCRATDEKVQQETHPNTSTPVDTPQSASPGAGAYFFGRFFSFGTSPPVSTATLSNPFAVKASSLADIDENLF
ncbi:hypothetical protein I4U23_014033 [Adineta vaga]|nr:hypothetical protein I4U23_014033 [Adineta vaga]